jgi:ATP-binding cassette subfamily B multidrug efflux pump
VLLPYPILLFIANRYTKYLYFYSEKVQEQLASISSMAHENLSGIQVIKMFCKEEEEIERFHGLNREYLERNMELTKKRGMLMPLIAGIGGLATLVLLWAGGAEIIAKRITLGDFVAFSGYLAMLLWPTIALGWIMNVLQRGLSAMNRISQIVTERPSQTPTARERKKPIDFRGDISIKNLSFSYGDRENILQDISLDIKQGSFVGIVGPIGSGKSTLISLIPRLYNVKEGMIFIDGRDINTFSREELRRNIGYVPQEGFLFSATIRENILFGVEEDRRAETYAEISGLMEEVGAFPDGLDSVVGQRGITLSGGQRQRTALARALAFEPRILILDDPFSSVDRKKEEEILSALREFAGERTLIMVSHRLSTLKEADQIIVLSRGSIEEKGNHKELLKKKGVYAEMFLRQQLKEELESI